MLAMLVHTPALRIWYPLGGGREVGSLYIFVLVDKEE
jgi:hypothetical protein